MAHIVAPLKITQNNFGGDYKKISKIGSGSYGKVYRVQDKDGNDAAIKCNIMPKTEIGTYSARELHINRTLGSHPYIIQPTNITRIPFSNDVLSPPLRKSSDIKFGAVETSEPHPDYMMDKIQLVYPFAEGGTLREYITKNRSTITLLETKRIMVEILLAMEYIHGKGYIHRDIREDNILMKKGDDGVFHVKIADFGLSKDYHAGMKHTPKLMTCWWRPPEVCLESTDYTTKADMWSVGCIFYYMIKGTYLISTTTEDGNILVSEILRALPYIVSQGDIDRVNKTNKKIINIKLSRTPMDVFLGLSKEGVSSIDSVGGSENLYSLIRGLLNFNPTNRLSATSALNNPFFDDMRDMITATRATHIPTPLVYGIVKVVDIVERRWGLEMAAGLYNIRHSISDTWYSHRVLFQSIYYFDLCLLDAVSRPQVKIQQMETPYSGMYISKKGAEIMYLVCLYSAAIFFNTTFEGLAYSNIASDDYKGPSEMQAAIGFEEYFRHKVLNYNFYQETVYECMCKDGQPTEEDVYSLFTFICYGKHSGYTSKDAYERVWKQNKSLFTPERQHQEPIKNRQGLSLFR